MRLVDHPTYRTWHRQMTVAWHAVDRQTAYECAQRGHDYRPDLWAAAHATYFQTLQSVDWTQVDRDLCMTPTS